MLDRRILLSLAVAGSFAAVPMKRCHAQTTGSIVAGATHLASSTVDDEKEDDDKGENKHHGADEKDNDHQEHEWKKQAMEIEQTVPMNMVPQAVLDAVKKEVPGGTITQAELEAKRGKIMYSFDVKTADMAYDVKITVDGKFYSKKVDDDNDEKDDKGEKSQKPTKPEAGEKD